MCPKASPRLSIHGSPTEKRRQLIRIAAPDFQRALPPDEHMTEVTPIYVNHSMQSKMETDEVHASPGGIEVSINADKENNEDKDRVLNWTAASIATTGVTFEGAVEEDRIRPVFVERGRPQKVFLNRLNTEDGTNPEKTPPTVRSPGTMAGYSPKPPRPISRPVLSPLDYQTFHSEDSLSQPDVVKRRVDMIHTVAPTSAEVNISTGLPYQVNEEQILDVRQGPGEYKVTASLDRRQYDSIERGSSHDMRRAQTMRTVHVQGKPPRSVPAQRTQQFVLHTSADASPATSPRQLTSLQTLAASPKAQRCTALPESPRRGLIQMMDTALESPTQPYDITNFPYLSKELMLQVTQSDKGPRVDSETLKNYTEGPLIEAGIKQIHPFLSDWGHSVEADGETKPQVSGDPGADAKQHTKSSVQNFLNTCVRLKSVDLQGHFAAFHYPLRAFNSSLWRSCARFVDWNNLKVMQEPGFITEYAELPAIHHDGEGFVYADKPIDVLLTTWLDCHQTSPPSEVVPQSPNTALVKPAHIYHPISFAVRLDQLLLHTERTEQEKVADICFRLAALLSYAHCRKCLVNLNRPLNSIASDPKDVLVILSTSNCLMLFKTSPSNTDQTGLEYDPLVKSLCSLEGSVEQGVDNLVQKLEEKMTSETEHLNFSSRLLTAIAPPDWMALCCSRIYLKQQ
ncbi:unnamed protein product [Echinostoma caproni]|uniref:ANK_REP_REGION domain-containing protein n=1 Tax=Echinostoma caproni TaxID=27848 RepID=A0A183A5G6_9TREM|nr:unnamed protein product [Echinostoma caproni]